ncbi:MAG: transketolase C-terminal domain-containing protein, partial [Spirochaetota bacterium]
EVHAICREGKMEDLLAQLAAHRLDIVLADEPPASNTNFRFFNHPLGETGTTFLAEEKLAAKLKRRFPASLQDAPALFPTENTALRRSLETWFRAKDVRPRVVAEFEDLALMRVIPGLRVVEPSDPVSLAAFVRLAAETRGCVYLRLQRQVATVLYPEGERFEWGKAKTLRNGADGAAAGTLRDGSRGDGSRGDGSRGEDAVIVALGAIMVGEALKAADLLAAEGLRVTVIDALSLKPLDTATILAAVKRCPLLVTAENHQAIGGLGSAVAEAIAEAGLAVRFARVGIKDEFGEVGTRDWLQDRFGLRAVNIVAAIKALRR